MDLLDIILIVCLPVFFVLGYLVRVLYAKAKLTSAEQQATRLQSEAVKNAETVRQEILLEGRNQLLEEKKAQEKENREQRIELQKTERKLSDKQEALDRRQSELEDAKRRADEKMEELDRQAENVKAELERVAGVTRDEAKGELMERIKDEAYRDSQSLVSKIREEAEIDGEKIASRIIVTTMQRIASGVVADNCVSTVNLSSDELKGRIIGREGRNIRALEMLTGTDIIIDDTPEAVVISSFNPVRRAIAQASLEQLVSDGRIHPQRIEDIVNKVTKEINRKVFEEGERVIMDLGLTSMSPEMTRSIGRLYYRKSYGQNILSHSRETAVIAGMMAAELGLNVQLAKRGALLHDLGKGLDSDNCVGHAESGADLAARLGENKDVVNAIRSHHNDVQPESLEAVLVQIADAISASRPGGRNESEENYIRRLDSIEKIALSFDGVDKAFAIQAGRDLRVMVDEKKVSDQRAGEIAKSIAERISAELRFPGKIRITMIRESKFVEFAV